MIQWHRILGLMMMDLFKATPYEVEVEKELSLKQQRLDVIVIKTQEGEINKTPPDGLETLKDYNLVSYKSISDTLSAMDIG